MVAKCIEHKYIAAELKTYCLTCFLRTVLGDMVDMSLSLTSDILFQDRAVDSFFVPDADYYSQTG